MHPAGTKVPARRARWAISAIFMANGVLIGSWAAHIPLAQERLGLSHATLGVMLLALAAGALIAMPLAGGLSSRLGSAHVTRLSSILFCLAFPLPVLSPHPLVFALAVFLFGATNGAMDVSMNAHAVAVERRLMRPVMSSFHGMFSLGGLLGAGLAALLLPRMPAFAHAFLVSLVALVVVIVACRDLLPGREDAQAGGSAFALPNRATLALGFLAFVAFTSEGAILDWSAIHLRTSLEITPGLAATGYAAFSATMALARFGGDWLRGHVGGVALMRMSALLAAAGLALSLLTGSPALAVAGYAIVGLGMANLVPVIFTAAGRVPGQAAGTGIAAVATMGYAGFLSGPPIIGFVAQLTSLAAALGMVVLSCVIVAVLAAAAREQHPTTMQEFEEPA